MNKFIKIFFIILISLLYLSSAYNKITNFNNVADGLKNKLDSSILFNWTHNLGFDISKFSLLIAIILLIVGPIMMLYGVSTDINLYTKIGALLLIVFLILATILYHPPNEAGQMNNFLKNISLIGSLGFIIV